MDQLPIAKKGEMAAGFKIIKIPPALPC